MRRQRMHLLTRRGINLNGALRIYWMTDIHLWDDVDGNPNHPNAIGTSWNPPWYWYAGSAKMRYFADRVNADAPDLAICSGDIVDRDDSLGLFLPVWNNISVPKALTIGNHDMTGYSYTNIVTALGYDGQPEIARSKFNMAFSLSNSKVAVRVLVIDTNIDSNGNHISTYAGALQADVITWIGSELSSCSEGIVLMFSHHGFYWSEFPAANRDALIAEINPIIASRGLKVYSLAGHEHGRTRPTKRTRLGGGLFDEWLGATYVDGLNGKFNVIYVLPDGSLYLDTITAPYPY